MNNNIAVEVHNYKRDIRPNLHSALKNCAKKHLIASKKLEKVDIYDFGGARQSHNSDVKRLFIFAYSTHDTYSQDNIDLPSPLPIFGIENTVTRFLPAEGRGIPYIQNGIVVAEYMADKNVLNITFDIFSQEGSVIIELLGAILDLVNVEHDKVNLLFSWRHTSDKNVLVKEINSRAAQRADMRVIELKQHVESYTSDINSYKRKITDYTNKLIKAMKDKEAAEQGGKDVVEKYIKDFDILIAHEKVDDVRYLDGKIEIRTNRIDIYDEDGNRYRGGNYRIVIDMERTLVLFYGDNARRSYWSHNDPHPHVSGNDHHACLGNVSSTIAELVSYNEIYALALTCIDFLEAVNLDDAAGKYIMNWDMIDEDDNVVQKGRVDGHPEEDYDDSEEEEYDGEDN